MPQICHAHCPKGGGGLGVAVVIVLVVIAVIARPVEAAARDAERLAVEVLEYLAIGTGAAVVLAVAGVTAMAVHARRAQARDALPAAQNRVHVIPGAVIPEVAETLSAPQRQAIEAPRAVLADLKAMASGLGYAVVPVSRDDD